MILFAIFMFIEPALCALILGGVVGYVSVEGIHFLNKVQQVGIQCEGKILEFVSDSDGYKTPIIEFKTAKGEVIEGTPYVSVSTSLSRVRSYKNKIHKPVPILFIPNNPKKFIVKNDEGYNYASLIFFAVAGSVLIVLGICELIGIVNFF